MPASRSLSLVTSPRATEDRALCDRAHCGPGADGGLCEGEGATARMKPPSPMFHTYSTNRKSLYIVNASRQIPLPITTSRTREIRPRGWGTVPRHMAGPHWGPGGSLCDMGRTGAQLCLAGRRLDALNRLGARQRIEGKGEGQLQYASLYSPLSMFCIYTIKKKEY